MIGEIYYVTGIPFEAARKVSILPNGHRASRLHGHSFLARIRTKLPDDWAIFPGAEVEQLQDCASQSIQPLDYSLLNDHLTVPTDENVARWIRKRIGLSSVDVVGVQSTNNQCVDIF